MRSKTESNFTGQPRGKLNSVSHQENMQQETVERKCNVQVEGQKKTQREKEKVHSSSLVTLSRS